MPDLSGLDDKNLQNMILNTALGGQGLRTQPAASFLFNQARLIDHALREYESARTACAEYAAGNQSAVFLAQSHLEAFVVSLWRCLRYARALQRLHRPGNVDVPAVPNSDLPRHRDKERLGAVRNAIIHTEEDIRAGAAPTALLVTKDGVELKGEALSYAELARWTEQVHAVTQSLVAYEGPGA